MPKCRRWYNKEMPDKRSHRGPDPQDAKLFAKQHLGRLQEAVFDMNWLLSRGYAEKSGLKLVGDRYRLTERQRTAVMRCACSQQQRRKRKHSEVSAKDLSGRPVALDGYNVLITVEAALSGAVLFKGADGCIRDLAGIHGTYRKVEETLPAIGCIKEALERLGVQDVLWLLDSPVSNSGRLKQLIGEWADRDNLKWQVQLAQNPDKALITTDRIILSSDSAVLDRCGHWFNFIAYVLCELPGPPARPWLIDLSG